MADKLSDLEIISVLQAEHSGAIGFDTDKGSISETRQELLDRYYGRPYGDELPGRSQVVSRDVLDTVESMMPSIMKIFTAGDDIVRFEPVTEDDEDDAEQATELLNHTFYKDNDGFSIIYTLFKDALLQKVGYVAYWWDVSEETKTEHYMDLTPEQVDDVYAGLDNGEVEYELLDQEEYTKMVEMPVEQQDPATGQIIEGIAEQPVQLTRLKIRCTRTRKQAKIVNIPPEDAAISERTPDLDDARYFVIRFHRTVSDMVEEGVPYEKAVELAETEHEGRYDSEVLSRHDDEEGDTSEGNLSADKSQWPITEYYHFIKIDVDGDGKSERRLIRTAGMTNNSYIISNEEVDDVQAVAITPIPVPHKFFGVCPAEMVTDIQRVKTTLWRQKLDNLYLMNNKRHVLDMDRANEFTIDDLLQNRPGGIVRTEGQGAITPLPTENIGTDVYNAIEYMDTLKEMRTGMTRYNQGLDADSLNKTATGVNMIMGAAQERQELIARVFGNGIKKLFKKLYKLLLKHQDYARTVRLRNDFVEVDPRALNADMDLTVNVGLGTGNKDQMLGHLMNLSMLQEKYFQLGLVGPEQLYNSAEKIVENMGLKTAEPYFMNPSNEESAQQMQQGQPQDDGGAAQAEADMAVKQAEIQAKTQAESQKIQANMQGKMAEIEANMALEREKFAQEIAFEREKFAQEMQLRRDELFTEAQLKDKSLNMQQATATNLGAEA